MTKIALILLCFGSFASLAQSPTTISCQSDGLKVTYSGQRGDLPAYFHINFFGKEHSALNDKIISGTTIFGQTLSLVTENIPDQSLGYLTFILPTINIRDRNYPVVFKSKVIKSKRTTTIFGPGLIHGLIDQLTDVYDVNCEAVIYPNN